MEQIYVLQLENGKYYVGKTTDVMKRFAQHSNGTGAAWTRTYKPVRMLECRALNGDHDENNVTKDYMKKYGINNVRGGSYTQVTLPDDVESVLQREFRGNADVCYKCNLTGHFANACPNGVQPSIKIVRPPKEEEPWWIAPATIALKVLTAPPKAKAKAKKATGACYRCGRTSHYSPDCYATTHVDGYDLE
jgi:cellular nucleic acid-binding protein